MIPIELTSFYAVWKGSNFCYMWISTYPRIIGGIIILSSFNYLDPLSKINWLHIRVYFCTLSSILYVYPYASTTLYGLLYLCTKFEMEKCDSSNFIPPQDYFAHPQPISFP